MKKFFCCLFLLLFCFALFGCGENTENTSEKENIVSVQMESDGYFNITSKDFEDNYFLTYMADSVELYEQEMGENGSKIYKYNLYQDSDVTKCALFCDANTDRIAGLSYSFPSHKAMTIGLLVMGELNENEQFIDEFTDTISHLQNGETYGEYNPNGDIYYCYYKEGDTGNFAIVSGVNTSNSANEQSSNSVSEAESGNSSTAITVGQKNALSKAQEYLSVMAFSYNGLIEQLKYEGFSDDESKYAVDNCGADWSQQAAKKAKEYLGVMSFSRQGLIEQLEYEGFTTEQAEYGVSAAGY